MATDATSLVWSGQFAVAPSSRPSQLPGDKLLLPASALEQLLAAAPLVASDAPARHPYTSTFDPLNPYTYAAERQARQHLQDRQHQLPHPLTFRLVNPQNGRIVYAGIREFSAEDGTVVLSSFLRKTLALDDSKGASPPSDSDGGGDADAAMVDGVEELAIHQNSLPRVTVHAKQLPKGSYVKLRPLEAGYDPEDWKSLLEQHLRTNFTTLTNGETLVVPGGRSSGGQKEEFRFLVDGFKPEGDGICVVDTDLEVDIEALDEEQARETLKRIAAKRLRAPGTQEGSSVGGTLDLFREQEGQVVAGEYVDYEIPSWDRSQGVEIDLSGLDDEEELDLFVSPHSPRQQAKPRADEHVFADLDSRHPKRIRLSPTNVEMEGAEALWVSVHAYAPLSADDAPRLKSTPKQYRIRAAPFDPKQSIVEKNGPVQASEAPPNPDEVRCKNCHQWVPQRTLVLHENFCLRNNILCPQGCGTVFQKRSSAYQNHWHCPHDSSYGNTSLSHTKHDQFYHAPQTCSSCARPFPSLAQLAHHKTTVCPGKLILCQFCHLLVPQEGDPDTPNPEALLSNLTPHELADGARTTECHLCAKIVRLRDMGIHLKHHEMEKQSRPAPRVCRNVNCGRTLDGVGKNGDTRAGTRMGQGPGNDIGLCSVCFGPLYVSMYDPEGKALRRRVERRYLGQLLTGCGRAWCRNEFCKSGRKNRGIEPQSVTTKDALPMIKPFLDSLSAGTTPLHLCVDEGSQRRRGLAEMLAAEGGYGLEWCVAALEASAGDLDRAHSWLKDWAPEQRT